MADAGLLARVDRVRGALAAAGVSLEELGAAPEPPWFAELRTGRHLSLGPQELQETADHLAGIAVETVLSDEACTSVLSQIEVLTTLRGLKDDGLEFRFCHGEFPEDAATLRFLADYARGRIAAATEGDDDAAAASPEDAS
ncbi:hypothetical protein [Streptomyces sp. NPDC047043]|uniref:hypothetical protein n=1 Tax=Streptomyces sp. NPDC047043 TaxID=3154497 RepID=UPI0033C255F2